MITGRPPDAIRTTPNEDAWTSITTAATSAARRYNPDRGLSHQAIRDAVAKRSRLALGYAIAVHDTRRTTAYLAHKSGMDLPDIQALLRHKEPTITWKYIGNEPDFESRMLSTRLTFG